MARTFLSSPYLLLYHLLMLLLKGNQRLIAGFKKSKGCEHYWLAQTTDSMRLLSLVCLPLVNELQQSIASYDQRGRTAIYSSDVKYPRAELTCFLSVIATDTSRRAKRVGQRFSELMNLALSWRKASNVRKSSGIFGIDNQIRRVS